MSQVVFLCTEREEIHDNQIQLGTCSWGCGMPNKEMN